MTPLWLRRLIDQGDRVPQSFKPKAALSVCRRCKASVFTGLEDGMGKPVVCTAEPLSMKGEAWARSKGIRTYRLYGRSAKVWELCYRTAWDILVMPCSSTMGSGAVVVVVVEHDCKVVMPFDCLEESVS